MAVLEKIRVKFGLAVSIIIALALLSFIIDPGTLETAMNSMSSKYDVGKIAGKSISYSDFQETVDRFTTINEVATGSSVRNEQQSRQIRDAAWQSLVDKHLFLKKAKAAGIGVGEAEMLDLTTGSNPSPVIAQNFSNEQGEFDPSLLTQFVQNISTDQTGRLKVFWDYLQNTVYTQQFYNKYGSLFSASRFMNPLEKAQSLAENNTTANVDYVFVAYPYGQNDTTIQVSSDEIKAFYKKHPQFFEQKANRDIEYVVYEVVPSAEDIAATSNEFNEAYEGFGAADNVKNYLLKNSDRQLNSYWYKAGELNSINSELNDFVFSNNAGVSPVIKSGNSFYAARIMDTKPISDSAYVKHILLQGAKAADLADSLLGVVKKGGNFSALAAEFSADQGSAADGELGNIGWMTQNYMIPGFESVITATVGEPFVLNTQYGTHVVLVSKKSAPVLKKQVAILEKTAIASKETFNKFYSEANKFATIAAADGYDAAVDSTGTYSHKLNVLESTSSYGAVDQAKEVTRWVFDHKKDKTSDIITVNNNYFFVVTVKGIHEEGIAPIGEVAQQIRQNLYTDKLAAARKADAAAKMAGKSSLEEIAEALGSVVTNDPAVSFASLGSRSLDPGFVGAAFVAPEGQICGPVAGAIGTYVFRVNSRETGSFFTEEDANTQNLQKAQYSSQMIVPMMSQNGTVVDHRDRFF
ncbi:MAG: SurA N-terminal domain-containing protein [Bacteroidales bacterium]|nr:SurA N-terminal domain-containing protein [Bacteroidales bacterium]